MSFCSYFSPSSRKKFVLFLIPCLKKIIMRTEEPIAEILAQTFPKIMQSLGHIMTDSNIKVNIFLKSYFMFGRSNFTPNILFYIVNP